MPRTVVALLSFPWLIAFAAAPASAESAVGAPGGPLFARHVSAVLSRSGCNGGTCHGAVQGQNGFRLSLFGTNPALDYEQIVRAGSARRLNLHEPEKSLILLKATGAVPHGGGVRFDSGSVEYRTLRAWVAAGAPVDAFDRSRLTEIRATPATAVAKPGESYRLRVEARFADGSTEDVTDLCSFESLDRPTAAVDEAGRVTAAGVGDATLLVRYRFETTTAGVAVPRVDGATFPAVKANNYVDEHILAKLRRLNLHPAGPADDATFLRRVSLDVCGELPKPEEIRAFLADKDPNKRGKKIDELLNRPGYAAVWTLKLCDILKATDFGVYADALKLEDDAPRFQEWIRARLADNMPYDELAARIITATSRDGRDAKAWAEEVEQMFLGSAGGADTAIYAKRKSPDLYWQRAGASGVSGTLQVAHAFLGLRLECAQCHRHPHDVWQQDDLLSFANFFTRLRKVGFQGDNEKKYPELSALNKEYNAKAKEAGEKAKKLKATLDKDFKAPEKKAEADKLRKEIADWERHSKVYPEVGRRVLNSEVAHLPGEAAASVTSPLGTQKSTQYRLLGESKPVAVGKDEDPRKYVADWMRRPDNPFFARAIVNRVWAHYFGRGIVDPPDQLSPFNPPSHPELLAALCADFVRGGYDLKKLHRVILNSGTYQQSSSAAAGCAADRANYAYFYYRRLPAEVLVDAVNHATGTTESMGKNFGRRENMRAVELPYTPQNPFVVFMLEQFGKPARNSAVQCDCERDGGASVLQVLSFANHPRLRQKIADPSGAAARILKQSPTADGRIDEAFLTVLCRFPTDAERRSCREYLTNAASPASPEQGVQGLLWSLLNTREFLLQH
jgi:hypothetical protein